MKVKVSIKVESKGELIVALRRIESQVKESWNSITAEDVQCAELVDIQNKYKLKIKNN